VLDALLYHQSEVTVRRHHTGGGGDSDHVFALCAMLGFQFAPRIPDLKHRRLHSFDKPSAYPALEPMIAGRINVPLIRAHWSEILRVIASLRTGTMTASLIMRQLASLRIPTNPATYSNTKPATCSDLKPAGIPISSRPPSALFRGSRR